jgi:hypothetical protein
MLLTPLDMPVHLQQYLFQYLCEHVLYLCEHLFQYLCEYLHQYVLGIML